MINQSAEFLRYLSKSGIQLGIEGEIIESNPDAGILSFIHADSTVVLGYSNAESLLVQPL
ncbi:MAG: hypothetical protein R3C11_13130 [Planctomycetaceae bacterium]